MASMANIIAYFDMDRTILSGSSGLLYMRYLWRRGQASWRSMLLSSWYAALYKVGILNYPVVAAKLASSVSSNREEDTRELCQRFFDEMLANYIAPKAVQRLNEHRTQGHLVTVISAATAYVVGPVASHLGIEEYLCTQLEVVDGRFTGSVIEPGCYGPGKVYWARYYAQRHDADLAQAYFYTDSCTDLDLLELVGHPVAVNPDARLRGLAATHRWPVEYFYDSR
jgi:putative phosphoserine phosphatase/1-acylglycerol-3-phosphate O-acyltransferase